MNKKTGVPSCKIHGSKKIVEIIDHSKFIDNQIDNINDVGPDASNSEVGFEIKFIFKMHN